MASISPLKLNIAKRLREDKGFQKRFFQGQTQDEIAMSIRSLREKRKMRQIDLAKKSKMKQSAISRIEQANYSSWSFNTLLRVADALDARLRVMLEPAEAVIDRYEETEVAISAPEQYSVCSIIFDEQPTVKYEAGTYVSRDMVLSNLVQNQQFLTPVSRAIPTQAAFETTPVN
jgi:transcriptional regulator with XRE-family HTH domain